MSAAARAWTRTDLTSWLAVGLVAAGGAGITLAAGAALAGQTVVAAAAGAVVGVAAVLLLAGGWERTHPLALLALSVPLPALVRVGDVRIAPALLATAVVVLAWGAKQAPRTEGLRLGALPAGRLGILMVVVVVAALFASAPLPAIREAVSFALLLALLVIATHELAGRRDRVAALALALAGVAGVGGAVAALQSLGVVPSPFPLPGSGFRRATLGFEWPNEAAMLLVLLLPFSVHGFVVTRGSPARRALAAAGLAAALLGLASTFSRGSWLAALAAPAVLVLMGGWRSALRIWLFAAVAAVAVDGASGGAISGRVLMTVRDPLVLQRLGLMLVGVLMFRDHPVLGVGPGGFGERLDDYGPQVSTLWDYVGSAHNTYVQMAAETGLPGLLALAALLWGLFRVVLRGARRARSDPGMSLAERSLRRSILWAFTTACLVGMVEWCLNQGVGQIVMLIAAMGVGLEASGRTGPTAPGPATDFRPPGGVT